MGLIWESSRGNLEMVQILISQGADIHADGERALMSACEHGQLEVVQFLVSKGADIHINNEEALRWASLNGYLDVVQFLVSQGADVHGDKGAIETLLTELFEIWSVGGKVTRFYNPFVDNVIYVNGNRSSKFPYFY